MAIRFQCASCRQPIEVDDELAQRLVACPYCRKTITAPAESTLPDPEQVPVASPLRPNGVHSAQAPFYQPAPTRNTLAVVALGLACGIFVWLILAMIIASNHLLELEELTEAAKNVKTWEDQSRVMFEFADRQGGRFPTWFWAMGLVYLAAVVTWIAALICGLIAVRRVERRGFATAALVICGVSLGLICIVS
jgi:hypothetical protein